MAVSDTTRANVRLLTAWCTSTCGVQLHTVVPRTTEQRV